MIRILSYPIFFSNLVQILSLSFKQHSFSVRIRLLKWIHVKGYGNRKKDYRCSLKKITNRMLSKVAFCFDLISCVFQYKYIG
jgi:hypothetical protein